MEKYEKIEKLKKNKKKGLTQLQSKLKIIFTFYSAIGDPNHINNLKSSKFLKLIQDANIDSKSFTIDSIDLLFFAENKHKTKIDFEAFLEILPKIAQKKFPDQNTLSSFTTILQDNLLPLYDSLINETAFGENLGKLKEQIDDSTLAIVKHNIKLLSIIYCV